MFNKSEIIKIAHKQTKHDRETWPRQHEESYSATFSRCLSAAWNEAKQELVYGKPKVSPELVAIQSEHERRNISDSRYFGSSIYHQTKQEIHRLKQAA